MEELYRKTYIKHWFIQQMKELVELEEEILSFKGKELPAELLVKAKKDGFSDRYLAMILTSPRRRSGKGALSSDLNRAGKRYP